MRNKDSDSDSVGWVDDRPVVVTGNWKGWVDIVTGLKRGRTEGKDEASGKGGGDLGIGITLAYNVFLSRA